MSTQMQFFVAILKLLLLVLLYINTHTHTTQKDTVGTMCVNKVKFNPVRETTCLCTNTHDKWVG